MKRSDFLKELYTRLDVFLNSGRDQNCVDFILDQCEDMGMLPPKITVKSVMPGVHDFEKNEWEKE